MYLDQHCCGRAADSQCRRSCYEIFRNEIKDSTIVNRLIQACGDVMPHQPMWKCFMENTEPASEGPFAGKLKCCSKAKSYECKQLCSQLYRNPWSESDSWNEFEQTCIYNTEHGDLQQCLEETSEPCRMGCSSMQFCTAFNRPTALFRACNEDSDFMAKHHYKLWSKGSIDLPHMKIPVKDIETCEADLWKAVACSLQIKPCDAETGETIICKSDCLFLLNKCADKGKFQPGIDIAELCEMFSPSDKQDNCISLSAFTESANIQEVEPGSVTQPCRPNPCENGEVCVINRNRCRPKKGKCQKYNCVPGCKVRHKTNMVVPVGSTVLVPNSTKEETCFKACTCTETGHFRSCIRLPCIKFSSCKMGGKLIDHGTIFEKDCNTCSCYAGRVTCSQYSCSHAQYLADPSCDCANQHEPMCMERGRKYFSRCTEICFANVSAKTQPCKLQDPCIPSPCKSKERCVPILRVCLSTASDCLQYECLPRYRQCLRILNNAALTTRKKITHHSYSSNNMQNNPSSYFFSPTTKFFDLVSVCDNRNHDHENICKLVKNKRNKFSYLGQCQTKCRKSVNNTNCGYDMMTYDNDCMREANLVLAQYKGTCKGETGSEPCNNVACPPLSNSDCVSILPPGSCCPLCGAMIRILIDQVQIKIIEKVASKGPVTVRNILLLLRHLIDVLECQLYGHLSIGGELVVIIVSTEPRPSLVQIEACAREAKRISILINKRRSSANLITSPLIASVVSPSLGSASLVSSSVLLLVVLVFQSMSFSIT